jgi:hypothetical protein
LQSEGMNLDALQAEVSETREAQQLLQRFVALTE